MLLLKKKSSSKFLSILYEIRTIIPVVVQFDVSCLIACIFVILLKFATSLVTDEYM